MTHSTLPCRRTARLSAWSHLDPKFSTPAAPKTVRVCGILVVTSPHDPDRWTSKGADKAGNDSACAVDAISFFGNPPAFQVSCCVLRV